MFCKYCGKEVADNAVVCPHCGVQIAELKRSNAPAPKTSSDMAVASFILSLLGLSPIGLIIGIVALKQCKRDNLDGRGFAIAGIVLGAIGSVAYIGVIILIGSCIASCSAALNEVALNSILPL